MCVHSQTGNLELSRRGRSSLMVHVQQHRTHSTRSRLSCEHRKVPPTVSFPPAGRTAVPHYLRTFSGSTFSLGQAVLPTGTAAFFLLPTLSRRQSLTYLGTFSGKGSLQVVLQCSVGSALSSSGGAPCVRNPVGEEVAPCCNCWMNLSVKGLLYANYDSLLFMLGLSPISVARDVL